SSRAVVFGCPLRIGLLNAAFAANETPGMVRHPRAVSVERDHESGHETHLIEAGDPASRTTRLKKKRLTTQSSVSATSSGTRGSIIHLASAIAADSIPTERLTFNSS